MERISVLFRANAYRSDKTELKIIASANCSSSFEKILGAEVRFNYHITSKAC